MNIQSLQTGNFTYQQDSFPLDALLFLLSYLTTSLAPFLILHPPSMPSQPPSLVLEAATLQLSSMAILLFTPVVLWAERIAQIVLTQIPPHAHLSLKASHHVSCKPKQQASGQHGRKTSLYTPSWCTWCQSCQQRLGLFSLAASPQTPELQGGPYSTHSMGTGNKLNTD